MGNIDLYGPDKATKIITNPELGSGECQSEESSELDRFLFFLYPLCSVTLGKFSKPGLMLCNWSIVPMRIILDGRSEFRFGSTRYQFVALLAFSLSGHEMVITIVTSRKCFENFEVTFKCKPSLSPF